MYEGTGTMQVSFVYHYFACTHNSNYTLVTVNRRSRKHSTAETKELKRKFRKSVSKALHARHYMQGALSSCFCTYVFILTFSFSYLRWFHILYISIFHLPTVNPDPIWAYEYMHIPVVKTLLAYLQLHVYSHTLYHSL